MLRHRPLPRRLRARHQPALHAADGAPRARAAARRRRAPHRRQKRVQAHEPRRARALAPATRARSACATQSLVPSRTRRATGCDLLHRLQHAEDAAHRAAMPGRARSPRRELRGARRAFELLRHPADAPGRRRQCRPPGLPDHRALRGHRHLAGARVVPDLPDPVRRNAAARLPGDPRPGLRHDDVPGLARAAPAGADCVDEHPGARAGRDLRVPRRARCAGCGTRDPARGAGTRAGRSGDCGRRLPPQLARERAGISRPIACRTAAQGRGGRRDHARRDLPRRPSRTGRA